MELTRQQINRIRAMYIGCKIINPESGIKYELNCYQLNYYKNSDDSIKILLRPLSAITDEEAVAVSKICYPNDSELGPMSNPTENAIRGIRVWTGKTLSDLRGITGAELHNMNGQKLSAVFQYLIQQSFAVPLFIATGHPDNGKNAVELGVGNYI